MRNKKTKPEDIDEYIEGFPEDIQEILEKIRKVINKVAPDAEETISYGIPTFRQKGNLVHFAAYRNHIGFYPAPSGIKAFEKELSTYNRAKGSVQFPIDQSIPSYSSAQIISTNNLNLSKDMPDKIIKTEAILNCSIEHAFHFFTDNSLLSKWLTSKADVEMKVGGKYELFWTPQDPDLTNNSTFGCKVLAVEQPYYFNIEWRGNADHKGFMNNVRPLTNVTALFIPLDGQKTKVILLHTGWRQGEDWESARKYFIHAWAGAFQKLEKLVN